MAKVSPTARQKAGIQAGGDETSFPGVTWKGAIRALEDEGDHQDQNIFLLIIHHI